MQIELKCKINVKNEKRKPNLPMLPRFAPVAYSNLFYAASVRRQCRRFVCRRFKSPLPFALQAMNPPQ
jgi:hypothetical protein